MEEHMGMAYQTDPNTNQANNQETTTHSDQTQEQVNYSKLTTKPVTYYDLTMEPETFDELVVQQNELEDEIRKNEKHNKRIKIRLFKKVLKLAGAFSLVPIAATSAIVKLNNPENMIVKQKAIVSYELDADGNIREVNREHRNITNQEYSEGYITNTYVTYNSPWEKTEYGNYERDETTYTFSYEKAKIDSVIEFIESEEEITEENLKKVINPDNHVMKTETIHRVLPTVSKEDLNSGASITGSFRIKDPEDIKERKMTKEERQNLIIQIIIGSIAYMTLEAMILYKLSNRKRKKEELKYIDDSDKRKKLKEIIDKILNYDEFAKLVIEQPEIKEELLAKRDAFDELALEQYKLDIQLKNEQLENKRKKRKERIKVFANMAKIAGALALTPTACALGINHAKNSGLGYDDKHAYVSYELDEDGKLNETSREYVVKGDHSPITTTKYYTAWQERPDGKYERYECVYKIESTEETRDIIMELLNSNEEISLERVDELIKSFEGNKLEKNHIVKTEVSKEELKQDNHIEFRYSNFDYNDIKYSQENDSILHLKMDAFVLTCFMTTLLGLYFGNKKRKETEYIDTEETVNKLNTIKEQIINYDAFAQLDSPKQPESEKQEEHGMQM